MTFSPAGSASIIVASSLAWPTLDNTVKAREFPAVCGGVLTAESSSYRIRP